MNHRLTRTHDLKALLLALVILAAFGTQTARAQSLEWNQRATGSPAGRHAPKMTYDSVRGVSVLFGGNGPNGSLSPGNTWEWDGTVWTGWPTVGNVVAPAPRFYHAMVYDSARHVTVLFGGRTGSTDNGDTWEWNGIAWTQRVVPGPSARHGLAMAYDSARGVTVLFGGTGESGLSMKSDTWEWDGTNWTQRLVPGPALRGFHAMTYDSSRGVTVLFGGSAPAVYYGDTWEWNGTAWNQRIVSGPSPRSNHAMAYDTARHVTVLYGGSLDPTGVSDETWEWDGASWARRTVSGPAERTNLAMAYDSARGVTVLFGGHRTGIDPYPNDTWELRAVCVADYDGNTFVNGDDFDAFVLDFYYGNQAADIDHNTFVNGDDFDFFTDHFVAGC